MKAYTIKWFPDLKRATFQLGHFKESPIAEADLNELRTKWFELLPQPRQAAEVPEFQPFLLFALGQTLRKMDDPDHRVIDLAKHSYATGVPVGMGEKMPRTPSVFERKVKWRKYDETEPCFEAQNYASAVEAGEMLEQQFKEEENWG